MVLTSGTVITPDLLPDSIIGRPSALSMIGAREDASLFDIMEDAERRIIGEMLEKCAWNQTETAKRFRIPLSTLNQKIKRLGIELEKRALRENGIQ